MSVRVEPSPIRQPLKHGRTEAREGRAHVAAHALSRLDPQLAALIEKAGPHRPIITRDPFIALVGSILQQQISMSAAAAVQARLKTLCPRGRITPKAILDLSDEALRRAGLSRQKIAYVRSLAERFASGELDSRRLRRMTDEEVIGATTAVKGIGRWTAEMLLIFCLERPDVWPIDDLGLRKAVRDFLGLSELPDAETMEIVGRPWRPHRTYASWYLWRSLEGPFMPGIALA
jgi:DNA-3-methyladenine glycosylase II